MNIFKKKKCIYFLTYRGNSNYGYRMSLVHGKPDIKELFEWSQEKIKEASENSGEDHLIITDLKIIRS